MKTDKRLWLASASFLLLIILLFSLIIFHRQAEPEKRYVLLSFDVEPVDEQQSVMDVLDVVYRQNVPATFFVTGEYAEQHPHIVELMTGREIASHGHSHRPFTRMTDKERSEELRKSKEILQNLSGQEIIGFRAPYNRVDKETLALLGKEGYLYDASMVKGWGIAYPSVKDLDIGEIPVSSVLGIPLEDVAWLHYLKIPGAYFYILRNKDSRIESYLFHPHHIATHKKEFEDFINYLKQQNVIFISHAELIKMQDEGV